MVSTLDPIFTFGGVVQVHDHHESKATYTVNNSGHRHKQIRAATCQFGVLDAPPETHYGNPFAVLFGGGLERRPFSQKKRGGWLLRPASGCARHSIVTGSAGLPPHSILPGGENPLPERECDASCLLFFSKHSLCSFWPSFVGSRKSTQTFLTAKTQRDLGTKSAIHQTR